ncbi:YihY/virulence factor BrkB family protein [Luteimonas sp. RD2P54]|uniref:YihY/virulence factor BrkB family protein n=1 Tax=Luteimonas endophytica TaxID=3042023 RepID=A0ABT6JEE2_9GAMM|nr:YihY/virulence factor BrkB family protein [Luteimonas endophytica]MDH5824573.1 YihY/virulence factor BrkB family protein [Luteimonas endophytica]
MPLPATDLRTRLLRTVQDSLPAAVVRRFIEIDLLTHAASLSFFTLISLAPLLVLLLWLTSLLYPSAQAALIDQVGDLAGASAEEVAGTVIDNARQRPDLGSLAGLWSTLLLLLGATVVFARLQQTLNLIFHTDARRLALWAWLRKRVFSFGVVLALGFLLLVSTLLSTVLELVFSGVPSLLPAIGNASAFALYAFAFGLLYHYLPDRRVRWHQALLGGVLTAALFVLGRWGIGLYIRQAAPGSAYGSMGTLVVLLVWMYYAAMVFFVGALITAVIDERWRERRGTPEDEASLPPDLAVEAEPPPRRPPG